MMPPAAQSAVAGLFDQWARTGRGERMARGHWPMVVQILSRMGLNPGMTALDVGCGNGYAVRAMAERVRLVADSSGSLDTATLDKAQVIGIDMAPDMVELAQQHPANAGLPVRYQVAVADALPFEAETFDRILSVEALYYMPDPLAALKAWTRALKPGGSLWVMVDFYQENPYSAGWDTLMGLSMHYLSERTYRELFEKAGLTAVSSDRLLNLMPMDLDEVTQFQPGWGYESINDVRRFRTEVGSLLITGKKSSLDIPDDLDEAPAP